MGLKEKFIMFCELSKSANESKEHKGSDHPDTVKAYAKANDMKKKILEGIDENRNN